MTLSTRPSPIAAKLHPATARSADASITIIATTGTVARVTHRCNVVVDFIAPLRALQHRIEGGIMLAIMSFRSVENLYHNDAASHAS
jgi:hypothetical protein